MTERFRRQQEDAPASPTAIAQETGMEAPGLADVRGTPEEGLLPVDEAAGFGGRQTGAGAGGRHGGDGNGGGAQGGGRGGGNGNGLVARGEGRGGANGSGAGPRGAGPDGADVMDDAYDLIPGQSGNEGLAHMPETDS